jgi:hypothetical protein
MSPAPTTRGRHIDCEGFAYLAQTLHRRWTLHAALTDQVRALRFATEFRRHGLHVTVVPMSRPQPGQAPSTFLLLADGPIPAYPDFLVSPPPTDPVRATCTIKVKEASRASFQPG